MPDFSKLLNHASGLAEAPKLLPEGTYSGVIPSQPTMVERDTKDGKRNILSIPIKLTGVEQLDDEGQQSAVPENLSQRKYPWASKDFFLDAEDKDSFYGLDQLLRSCGVKPDGRAYGELLPELVGAAIQVKVSKRTYADKQTGEQKEANQIGRVVGA